jgi:HPr kinase/phosphorylase
MPTRARKQAPITVEKFQKDYGEKLKMDLVAGEPGLKRPIRESSVNRPSLALTGFFKYFAHKRVQVFGSGEMTYLKTLSKERQTEVLTELARHPVPCIVLSRNFHVPSTMRAVADAANLPIFRTPLITMNFINMATLCLDYEFAPVATIHGTMMDIQGVGVLIRGDSGVGKSECALALIERGYSLVADDMTRVRLLDERELRATSMDLNRGHMECRGLGIINVAKMFGIRAIRMDKRIDMVVTLRDFTPDVIEERTGLEQSYLEMLGIEVPHIELFVRPGRDIARLVEVAALVQALKMTGHDPAREFNERLIASMQAELD